MGFRDIDIFSCYESGIEDIIEDFYEPVLANAILYDRIAGFFSSSSLAIASRGLYSLIKNGGRMRLITSPKLGIEDAKIIEDYVTGKSTLHSDIFNIDLESINDDFFINHVKALGWMLRNNLLEIKLAVVYNNLGQPCSDKELEEKGLFHQKVGILKDSEGNEISFSGSINESASAWIYNDEEFKVFKGWSDSKEYFERDKSRFHEIWNGQRKNTKVFDLPDAVRRKLISLSVNFDIETISLAEYKKRKLKHGKKIVRHIPLFYYQSDALEQWIANDYRLLFEMATGTGKTRTAIAGIERVMSTSEKFVAIISTPQNTLSKQWKDEVEKLNLIFDRTEIIDGTVSNWKHKLSKMLLDNATGMANHCIIYTTHNTASSENFVTTIKNELSPRTISLFVGDEVHWLGAAQFRKALLPNYIYRIGLSATPSRWFDEEGTSFLKYYFGNNSFVFSIHDALTKINPLTGKHFLVNYYYHISTISLDADETNEYKRVSKQIVKLARNKDTDLDSLEKYQRALERRANITKNAVAKYAVLEGILDELKNQNKLQDTIIFISPEQKERVMDILFKKRIVFHNLTESEGTRKEQRFGGISEREYIIQQFKEKSYKALVAIKCLDEGIDIPSASVGILMASSTNPREYVQRIGRIIRQDENKSFAHLYDICVNRIDSLDGEELEFEKTIRKKETIRIEEIAENAINPADAYEIISNLKY
nr:DEAD/DEAH box helicase family protein [uncultured Prevotella sp.]